ncbi:MULTISPECIES: hypothetical protein [unclassified Streptomyces]
MTLVLLLGIGLLVMFVVLGAYEAAPWDSRRARLARRIVRAAHFRKHGG